MILVIRKFTVRNGMEEAVRQAFVDRPHLVDSAPGYQRMEVLRALGHPEEFWLTTWWQDEASYDTWHRSHAYRDSHKGLPKGLKLVPGSTEIRRFEQMAA